MPILGCRLCGTLSRCLWNSWFSHQSESVLSGKAIDGAQISCDVSLLSIHLVALLPNQVVHLTSDHVLVQSESQIRRSLEGRPESAAPISIQFVRMPSPRFLPRVSFGGPRPPDRRAEYADSDCCSDLSGLDPVAGTTRDHNYNPLFDKAAPRSPISAMATQQQSQRQLWPVDNVAGAERESLARQEDGAATAAAAAAAAAVKASMAAARSPVSTVSKAKAQWRSSSLRLGESLWGAAPTALHSFNGDDESRISSNAMVSAAISNATDVFFARRRYSVSRTATALDRSSSGLWDVVDVSEGRQRSNRVSYDDANDTTESVNAPSSAESRPAGAPIATETNQARPLSPHASGDETGVEGSNPLSCVSLDGEAETGEAETAACIPGGNGATSGRGPEDRDEKREGAPPVTTRPQAAARGSATRACAEDLSPNTCGGGSEVRKFSWQLYRTK